MTSNTALGIALRRRWPGADGRKALMKKLGITMDDLLKPSAGGGGSANPDQLKLMRAAVEKELSGLEDERYVARMLAVLDEFCPTDRAEADDPNRDKAAALVGNDVDNLAQVRAHLKKAGLSDESIDEALRIAAAGGNEAKDRLPLDATRGGFGGYRSDRGRAPGERFASDEYLQRFPSAVVVAPAYAPDRARSRSTSWPNAAGLADYEKRFGGSHIVMG